MTIGILKAVAEAHEARRLAAGVGIEHAGQHHRLVGDEADGAALDAAEAGDDVLGKVRLDLEEIAFVGDLQDQLLDVVGFVGVVGDQPVERQIVLGDRLVAFDLRDSAVLEAGRRSTSRRICSSASTSLS